MLPSGTGRRRGLAEARRGAAERERGEGSTLVAGDVAATPREAPARTLARVAPPRAARAVAPRRRAEDGECCPGDIGGKGPSRAAPPRGPGRSALFTAGSRGQPRPVPGSYISRGRVRAPKT